MKKFFVLLLGLTLAQFVIAESPGEMDAFSVSGMKALKWNALQRNTFVLDQCMDEFNTMTVMLNDDYNATVQLCYSVYRFPYDLHCHGQAIQIWSFYQDQLFEDLVSCQNGNLAKPKMEGTK